VLGLSKRAELDVDCLSKAKLNGSARAFVAKPFKLLNLKWKVGTRKLYRCSFARSSFPSRNLM
jgi:hypothetical protein